MGRVSRRHQENARSADRPELFQACLSDSAMAADFVIRIGDAGRTGLAGLGRAGRQAGGVQSGPLGAFAHSVHAESCALCATRRLKSTAFGQKVTDRACLACHDGATHQAQQTFTPACTECHVEHQGASWLSATRDESCTQCHSNLKTKDRPTSFAAMITSFENGHPDFAALRSPDPGTIKFGHAVHLKSDLAWSARGQCNAVRVRRLPHGIEHLGPERTWRR